jgi:hypothetical protein
MWRARLVRLHWLLAAQFGFDPLRLWRSLRGLPPFALDWVRFRRAYDGRMTLMPCLHDRFEEGGTTKNEYFWQDLLVARWIFEAKPARHVDIGSRVDGFVAHVASFREIEVLDVRPITTRVPGIVFRQADLMRAADAALPGESCDSLSCLHAIEHFGLGRYGDLIDAHGHERGIAHMARLLALGGTFYLSTGLGRERVEFNAHRVFDPRSIVALAIASGLALQRLTVVDADGPREVEGDAATLERLASGRHVLGIFVFVKTAAAKVDE